MNDLKPCPFCGEKEQEISISSDFVSWTLYKVMCLSCGAASAPCEAPEIAIELWNRRAYE